MAYVTVGAVFAGSGNKGQVKRSPHEELALRVRMLRGRHVVDVLERIKAELGEGANNLGPVDLTRNPLRTYVNRLGQAYLVPPLVDDLDPRLAGLIGDLSASVTVDRYARAGGRPLPTRLLTVSRDVLRFRLGCNYAGTLLSWGERTRRPFAQLVTPDDLDVEYGAEDPLAPTVICHRRRRVVNGEAVDVREVYDLTDLEAPSYRIFEGKTDITEQATGRTFEGDGYPWRYAPTDDWPIGRPFHRIVISGDPRHVYQNIELVEGTLRVGALYTHWSAGVRDAGHPQRNVEGAEVSGLSSDADHNAQGIYTGPTTVVIWQRTNPSAAPVHWQDKPGADVEVTGRAVRMYELGLLSALGVPVDFEGTGGDPTETERRAMERLIAQTFADCRGHDGLVLRRLAAIANRASEATEGMDPLNLPERAPGVLYLEEVGQALGVEEDLQAGSLNGAQITAAAGVLESLRTGAVTVEAASELLSAVGLTADAVARALSTLPTPPPEEE